MEVATFRDLPWFHGSITRGVAEHRLSCQDAGTFLFRESESRAGFSLSLRVRDRIKHFMISQRDTEKYYLVGKEFEFDSLQELVVFYKTSPASSTDGTCLRTPCPKDVMERHEEEGASHYVALLDAGVNPEALESAQTKAKEKRASLDSMQASKAQPATPAARHSYEHVELRRASLEEEQDA